jgi:hypothetical protein
MVRSSLQPVSTGALAPMPRGPSFEINSDLIRRLLIAVTLLLCALYVAKDLKRGWVPHDEGYLSQTAERVLYGEVPHRDFDEGYTGGLTYLNAAAFRLFGTNLASIRYVLFLFVLAWIPALYYVASQFASAPMACALTLLGVAWSVPVYSGALPSWYNLFLATFGLAALLLYLKVEKRFWLFAAGLCGGISFLFKLTGLYFVAGVLLFLVFRERATADAEAEAKGALETYFYRAFLVACVAAYEILIFGLLRKSGNPTTFFYFGVPDLAIGGTILWLEFHLPQTPGGRFLRLFREGAIFCLGVAIPIGSFVLSCILNGSLHEFLYAIFVRPATQTKYAGSNAPFRMLAVGMVLNLVWVGVIFLRNSNIVNAFGIASILGVPVALYLARRDVRFDKLEWEAIWSLFPLLLLVGMGLMLRGARKGVGTLRYQHMFLVLSVTAGCSLIQYPSGGVAYFCYAAPLIILSAGAVMSALGSPPRWLLSGVFCFALSYVVFVLTPTFIYETNFVYSPEKNIARLDVSRGGGLRIFPDEARLYKTLYTVVKEHARGEYIYATPDCPQVYFLNGFRNPTRTFFDYFDVGPDRTARILATIHAHNVNLVVLNNAPHFSRKVPPDLRADLEKEFPDHISIDTFEVRWKP